MGVLLPPRLAHSAPWRVTDSFCCSRPAEGRLLALLSFVCVAFATYPLGMVVEADSVQVGDVLETRIIYVWRVLHRVNVDRLEPLCHLLCLMNWGIVLLEWRVPDRVTNVVDHR